MKMKVGVRENWRYYSRHVSKDANLGLDSQIQTVPLDIYSRYLRTSFMEISFFFFFFFFSYYSTVFQLNRLNCAVLEMLSCILLIHISTLAAYLPNVALVLNFPKKIQLWK